MMKKKMVGTLLSVALASVLMFSLAACGSEGTAENAASSASEAVSDATSEAESASSVAESATSGSSAAEQGDDDAVVWSDTDDDDATAAKSGDFALQRADYVIGLSNSFYGNNWRKQMVDSFTQAADQAKELGFI